MNRWPVEIIPASSGIAEMNGQIQVQVWALSCSGRYGEMLGPGLRTRLQQLEQYLSSSSVADLICRSQLHPIRFPKFYVDPESVRKKMFFRRSRELKYEEKLPAMVSASTNGFSTGSDGEGKLDESTIMAVETSLREALTLNNEEARALLGRIEHQKENFEAALHIFQGIQVDTIFPRVKYLIPTKSRHRGRSRSRTEVSQGITLPAAGLLLEAVYLKVKTLEKLARLTEAAEECNELLDSFESVFPHGMPDNLKDSKLQVFLNKILEFLPDLLKREGLYKDAIAAYRRALLSYSDRDRGLELGLAVLLLYGGVEAPPCPATQYERNFIPGNNLEEAILLLVIIARKNMLAKSAWDPRVMEHLSFALSVCGHFEALAQQFESVLPGIYGRNDRWYSLALCYSAAKKNKVALNLLVKSLTEAEKPNDVFSLLLAASICTESVELAAEGIRYSRVAVANTEGPLGYLKDRAWHILGIVLSKQVKAASSNAERARLQVEALSAWHEAAKVEKMDPDIRLHTGLLYAEQGNLNGALDCAKLFLELSSGASVRGWRFLALVLSAQQRLAEAEMVLDAALQESEKWEQGELLLTKAKVQIAQGKTVHAVETYKSLLGLVQTQCLNEEKGKIPELEVWQEMAAVYTSLSQWRDAESCLEKAKLLKRDSATTWYGYGNLYIAQSKIQEAMAAYNNALTLDPEHVESKVRVGAILSDRGGKSRTVSRSFLNDALHSQPRNPSAWYHLGVVHETEGRLDEAADCFQAAYVLSESLPVESFNSIIS